VPALPALTLYARAAGHSSVLSLRVPLSHKTRDLLVGVLNKYPTVKMVREEKKTAEKVLFSGKEAGMSFEKLDEDAKLGEEEFW
jgi:hypothetical protein